MPEERDPIKDMLSLAITSGRDDVKAAAQAVKAHYDAIVEQQFKTIGYLLVAHGGGLVSCITFVKDKIEFPALKACTSFFAYGFLAALVAYALTVILGQEGRAQFIFKGHTRLFNVMMLLSNLVVGVSAALLMINITLVSHTLGAF